MNISFLRFAFSLSGMPSGIRNTPLYAIPMIIVIYLF